MQIWSNGMSSGYRSQRDDIRARHRTGLRFSCCLHDLCQFLDLALRDEHASFSVSPGVVTKSARVMGHANTFDIELKPKTCNASSTCPVPESFHTDSGKHRGRLLNGVIPSSVSGIDIGCGRLWHPQMKAYSEAGHKIEARGLNRSP